MQIRFDLVGKTAERIFEECDREIVDKEKKCGVKNSIIMAFDISEFENDDAPANSQNGRIAELIKKIRDYSNLPFDQFQAAFPELRVLEKKCQDFDSMVRDPKTNYIQEILAALKNEQGTQEVNKDIT